MKNIQTTLEKVARAVSGQHGVQVIFQGSQAYTDGKQIVLPSLPADASKELVLDIQGYLDHELAHVLYSQFDALLLCKNHFHKWLSNHAEDSRIEKIISEVFPGTKLHLVPLNAKWNKIINDKWEQQTKMNRICLAVRSLMDSNEPRLDADTKPLFTAKVIKLSKSLSRAKDSWAIVDICGRILREIDKEQEKQEQQNPQENKKQDEKKSNKKEQKSSKEEQEGSGEESSEDEGQESTEGKEQESDQKGSSSSQGEETGEESSEDEGQESTEGKEQESDDEEADSEYDGSLNSKAMQKELKETSERECKDVHGYIDQKIKEEIKEEEKERQEIEQKPSEREFNDSRKHVPFTTKNDKVIDISKDKSDTYADIRNKVSNTVNKLVIELDRLFKVKEEERTVLEQERGRISRRGLARLVMDQNYRTPFKVRLKEETKNVAVQLVIDLSGSMIGAPVIMATLVASAISEALAKLDIDCEVVGFNTGYAFGEILEDVSRFNRFQDTLNHFIFKSFGSKNLEAISLMQLEAGGKNCDGESLRFCAKRLEQHRAKRKIMMVLSDGMPSCGGNRDILNSDLKKAVKEIGSVGIECVGIGIMTDAVEHFYSDFTVVDSLEELVSTSLKKLKAILI